jgi:hypothetical protein
MPDPVVDLNAATLTCTLCKPVDFATPWSYCEVKVCQPGHGVLFISLHVACPANLRLLEDLSVGDRLSVVGELAFAKAEGLPGSGQICVKVKELRRLDPAGRLPVQRRRRPAGARPPHGQRRPGPGRARPEVQGQRQRAHRADDAGAGQGAGAQRLLADGGPEARRGRCGH